MLQSVVERFLAAGGLDIFDNPAASRGRLLDAHRELLRAFVQAVDGTAEDKQLRADPNIVAHVHMHGFSDLDPATGKKNPYLGKLRVEVGRHTFALSEDDRDRRFTAHICDLWLPGELQGRRYGRQLVKAFMGLWIAMGVELVAATAVTEASRTAFPSWDSPSRGTTETVIRSIAIG